MDSTEHSNISTLEHLSKSKLHKSDWQPNSEEAEQVRDEEESSSPLEAEIWESPEVSETDAIPNHSQDEGHSVEPSGSLGVRISILEHRIDSIFTTTHF